MDSLPFFSVVVPTYNRVDILSKSLNSVISQSFQDFELIIVDNGSTDGTKEWLGANYSDHRIRYYYQKGTGSPAGPRNSGIGFANGDWICFLDSDDLWNINKLEVVRQTIEKNKKADVVCHNERLSMMGKDSGVVLHYGPYEKDFYRAMLLGGNRLSTSATCVRNSFLKEHDLLFNTSPDFAIVEDYDLWLRLAQKGAIFNFIKEPLGEYVVEEGCLSLNSPRMRNNIETMLRSHVFQLQDFNNNKNRLWSIIVFRLNVQDAKHEIIEGKYMRAIFRLFILIFTSPFGMLYYIKTLVRRKIASFM